MDWAAFPFVEKWLSEVRSIRQQWPELSQYQVASDWRTFQSSHSDKDLNHQLRWFKQSRLAYLAVMDAEDPTASPENHLTTIHQVTALAECMVQQALAFAVQQVKSRMGEVRDEQGNIIPFVVFALGKLGTGELNYSSDIDLVFVCGGQGQSDGPRVVNSERYFEKMGRLLIQCLDQFTQHGRVHRVDMRLRPFGSAAPLVCTAAALHNYIITEGREWERFAWMRARPVAGCKELAKEVLSLIQPFIYRRHLDYSVFDSLARVKLDMHALAQTHEDDIKLGPGGIREIEFIVQSMQVTFGGRHPQLQGEAMAPQFDKLCHVSHLDSAQVKALSEAWYFMRRLENLFQLVDDGQTHVPPAEERSRQAIAEVMGYDDWSSCQQQWLLHRDEVISQFKALFEDEANEQALAADQLLWVSETMALHFEDKMPQDREDQMRRLLERAIELATREFVQQQFLPIVLSIMRRPSYVMMLLQESALLPRLFGLLRQSSYFTTIIKQHPALLELLFEPEPLPKDMGVEWYRQQWRRPPEDEEQWMEAMRFFKHKHQFLLIEQRRHDTLTLRQGFSDLAACVVDLVVKKAWHDVLSRLGDVGLAAEDMMVLAYGSLGVRYMSLASDLDLVMVIDRDQLDPEQQVFIQRWGKRITHHLTVKTYHGVLYELDLQLRPNGQSGALVTNRAEFEHYQQHQAWVWEHAALIKARLINGSKAQQQWFVELRKRILTKTKDPNLVTEEMNKMSQKLHQLGRKGHDQEMELLTQVLLLAPKRPAVLDFDHYLAFLDQALGLGLIDESTRSELEALKSPT